MKMVKDFCAKVQAHARVMYSTKPMVGKIIWTILFMCCFGFILFTVTILSLALALSLLNYFSDMLPTIVSTIKNWLNMLAF